MNKKNTPNTFVTTVDLAKADQLKALLINYSCSLSTPPYTIFQGKKKGLTCTLYQSGKLVVQGKEKDEFIEFALEPEILGDFSYTYADLSVDKTPRIGVDESGKGDYFGPLCIAGVFADTTAIEKLVDLGVKDSKTTSDGKIYKLTKEIKSLCIYHVIAISPAKYNQLYSQFQNLNTLLGWGHATVIEQLIKKTQCTNVIIDKFASEYVVQRALAKKNLSPTLTQRHRAESDVVVAAASILAREAFLSGLQRLEKQYDTPLPKGASKKTIEAGRTFIAKHTKDLLPEVAKIHFKTTSDL